MKKISFLFGAMAAVALSGSASAYTYVGSRAVADGTLNLSITTDNTTGQLTKSNVLDWSITMTNSAGTVTLNGPASGNNSAFTYLSGNSLTATATQLLFDFEGTGHFQFDNFGQGGGSAYCMDSRNPVQNVCTGQHPSELLYLNGTASQDFNRSGTFVIGTVAGGVPEPATWAMLLSGFGMLGFAMRRRAQATAFVA